MIGFGHFGVAYTHCVYGAIAYVIALIFLDWMKNGRAFVVQSLSHYAVAFLVSLVIMPVILIGLTLMAGLIGGMKR